MTPEQFTYWLQGYFELRLNKDAAIDRDQANVIQDHLDLVFQKITPPRPAKAETPAETWGRLCATTQVGTDKLYC